MNWEMIWTKTWRTMIQTLIPFIPINVAMLDGFDPKIVVVEVLGAGLVCFLMNMLGESKENDEPIDEEDYE